MENVGDVDRRFGLLRVDAVLDSVHVLVVGDEGEDLCHVPLVKSIDEEDDGESLLHIELELFTGELGHWYNANSALDLVCRVSGRVRAPHIGGGQTVVAYYLSLYPL